MKLIDYMGYEIHLPTSGGKAGTGRNVTSTIQLRQHNCVVKQVRFTVADRKSRERAITKIQNWAKAHQ